MLSLLVPIIIQILVCTLTPSTTSLKYAITGQTSATGTHTLSISNYKPYTMPYAITSNTSNSSLTTFQTTFKNFYEANRAGITLLQQTSDSAISSFVLSAYESSTYNLATNYYTGISFNVINSTKVYANVYYSTLAYHSPAAILNEVSNVLLAYYTNSLNKSITTFNTPISYTSSLSVANLLDDLACIDLIPVAVLSFTTSVIVAFCISILVVHVGQEKADGSKSFQMLSGVHYSTYWLANHLFDFIILLIQIIFILSIILIVAKLENNTALEISLFTDNITIAVLFLLFFISIFSWASYAYVWSHLFNSEYTGFVTLFIILCIGSILDMGMAFVQIYLGLTGGSATSQVANTIVRWIFTAIFPNVLIKRAMYDIKLRSSSFCISTLNTYLGSKSIIYNLN